MPPTTVPAGPLIINHPIVHNGPALVALLAMALIAGLGGGAITGMLLYAKGRILWQ